MNRLPFEITGPHRKTRPVRHGFWRRLYADVMRFLLAPSPF